MEIPPQWFPIHPPPPAPTSSTLTEQAKCDSRGIGRYTTVPTAAQHIVFVLIFATYVEN